MTMQFTVFGRTNRMASPLRTLQKLAGVSQVGQGCDAILPGLECSAARAVENYTAGAKDSGRKISTTELQTLRNSTVIIAAESTLHCIEGNVGKWLLMSTGITPEWRYNVRT